MPEERDLIPWVGAKAPEPTVPPAPMEALTSQFYDWERRGRGWQVWDHPVVLEPPFVPFEGHLLPPPVLGFDDGRRPTILEKVVTAARRFVVSRRPSSFDPLPFDLDVPDPETDDDESAVTEIRVSVPPTLKVARDAAEQWILGLPVASSPIAFEILGLAKTITVQLVCRTPESTRVQRQLAGYFPDAVLTEESEVLANAWAAAGSEQLLVDFGLSREFMLPLRTVRGFDVDPLIGVVAALSDLDEGELGLLQLLFQPVRHPWADSVLRSVLDWEGRPFFLDAPEMVPGAKAKVSLPLYACVVRIAAKSADADRAWQIARALGGALRPLANPTGNELIPLENEGYEDAWHIEDLLNRQSHRSGMLLSNEELVSLVHPPSVSVRAEKLIRQVKKTRGVPAIAVGHPLVLGTNAHAGKTTPVTLNADQRSRHMYVVGATGTGKSTLLLNIIRQDLERGEGIGVLDPHGDLIDKILGLIPEKRIEDVVLVDPADAEYPVGFNILFAHTELEQTLLSSDLVAVFQRLSTSWGDQMTAVLANAILAFLESNEGGTLIDLRRFLVEADFRKKFLSTVRDPDIVYYWQKQFPLLQRTPQGPILTRLDTFLRPKLIRYMVAQKESKLDFATIMNEGKILLCRLSQGAIGEENAYLLGTLLVSKLQQTAMSRQAMAESERRPFYLYIDEFQHFVTPSMATILTGARKYHLSLVLAHQDLRQLQSRSPDVLSAVLSNPYTRICFRMGDHDARTLAEGFANFEAADLQNLGIGEAVARVERAEFDCNLETTLVPAAEEEAAKNRREQIIARSREKYARMREEVEALIRSAVPSVQAEPEAPMQPPVSRAPERAAVHAKPRPTEGGPRPAPLLPLVVQPPTPGRGGLAHKYLQSFFKDWGEGHGWRATIEESILDGQGSVDLAFRKGNLTVACEIGITTTAGHELGNIQKCLDAGFQVVALVSEPKMLAQVRALAEQALTEEQRARVHFRTQLDLYELLEELEAQAAGTEGTVRGYKVKVKHRPVPEKEKIAKRQAIGQILAKGMKRLKRGK